MGAGACRWVGALLALAVSGAAATIADGTASASAGKTAIAATYRPISAPDRSAGSWLERHGRGSPAAAGLVSDLDLVVTLFTR